jgi:hypothetical protein
MRCYRAAVSLDESQDKSQAKSSAESGLEMIKGFVSLSMPHSACPRFAAGRFARPGVDNASTRRWVHPLGGVAEHLMHGFSRRRR